MSVGSYQESTAVKAEDRKPSRTELDELDFDGEEEEEHEAVLKHQAMTALGERQRFLRESTSAAPAPAPPPLAQLTHREFKREYSITSTTSNDDTYITRFPSPTKSASPPLSAYPKPHPTAYELRDQSRSESEVSEVEEEDVKPSARELSLSLEPRGREELSVDWLEGLGLSSIDTTQEMDVKSFINHFIPPPLPPTILSAEVEGEEEEAKQKVRLQLSIAFDKEKEATRLAKKRKKKEAKEVRKRTRIAGESVVTELSEWTLMSLKREEQEELERLGKMDRDELGRLLRENQESERSEEEEEEDSEDSETEREVQHQNEEGMIEDEEPAPIITKRSPTASTRKSKENPKSFTTSWSSTPRLGPSSHGKKRDMAPGQLDADTVSQFLANLRSRTSSSTSSTTTSSSISSTTSSSRASSSTPSPTTDPRLRHPAYASRLPDVATPFLTNLFQQPSYLAELEEYDENDDGLGREKEDESWKKLVGKPVLKESLEASVTRWKNGMAPFPKLRERPIVPKESDELPPAYNLSTYLSILSLFSTFTPPFRPTSLYSPPSLLPTTTDTRSDPPSLIPNDLIHFIPGGCRERTHNVTSFWSSYKLGTLWNQVEKGEGDLMALSRLSEGKGGREVLKRWEEKGVEKEEFGEVVKELFSVDERGGTKEDCEKVWKDERWWVFKLHVIELILIRRSTYSLATKPLFEAISRELDLQRSTLETLEESIEVQDFAVEKSRYDKPDAARERFELKVMKEACEEKIKKLKGLREFLEELRDEEDDEDEGEESDTTVSGDRMDLGT